MMPKLDDREILKSDIIKTYEFLGMYADSRFCYFEQARKNKNIQDIAYEKGAIDSIELALNELEKIMEKGGIKYVKHKYKQ